MQKQLTYLFLFLIFLPNVLKGQEAPNATCIEVDGDNIIVFWEAPSDLQDFQYYLVYYSADGIAYANISGPVFGLQYQHNNVQPELGSRYFYIEAVYSSASAASEPLQSIWLRLDNFVPDYNPVLLLWNPISEPLPGGSDTNYEVYQEFPPGSSNWVLKASLTETTYTENVLVCDDSVNYKVVMQNSQGCQSVSNINGARFATIIEPPPPVIDSLSVDENGHMIVGWEPAASALEYFVFRWESTYWNKLDTVQDSYYIDTTVNACADLYSYTVEMRDTCLNVGPKDETEARTNMLLDTLIYQACEQSIQIKWTPYYFPDADVYEIWCSIDGGAFDKVGQVSGNETHFFHSNPQIQSQYTFFVRARFAGGSSTTCKKSVFTPDYSRPAFVYLANADVQLNGTIHLGAYVDTLPGICTWQLWRSELNGGNPALLQTLDKTDTTKIRLPMADEMADPNSGFYEYTLKALDSCGLEAMVSNELKTIWLTGEKRDDHINQLEWNAFEGWDAGVEQYYIYRMVGDEADPLPVDSVGNTTYSYTDDVGAIDQQNGQFTYWVQAKENDGNPYAYKGRSNSNRLNLFLESDLFMPNAFRPGGYTPSFKPVFRFFGGKAYLFQIYNRWGQLIFETMEPDLGWDGYYHGERIPQGVYVYRLVYTELSGKTHEQKGTVSVMY